MQPTGNKDLNGKDEYLAPDGVSKVYLAPDEYARIVSIANPNPVNVDLNVGANYSGTPKTLTSSTPKMESPIGLATADILGTDIATLEGRNKPVVKDPSPAPAPVQPAVSTEAPPKVPQPLNPQSSAQTPAMSGSGGMATVVDSQRTSKLVPKDVREAEVRAAKSSMDAIDAQAKASEAVSTATALKAQEDARLSEKFLEEEKIKQVQEQNYIERKQAELDAISADYSNMSIDNNNFWANKSTGDSILAALAIGLGAFGQVGSGDQGISPTLKILQSKIDQDIETQKANIAKAGNNVTTQRGLFSDVLKRTGDERLARLKTHEMGLKSALAQFDQTIAASNNQLLQAKYQQEKANIENALVQNQIAQADVLVTEAKTVPIPTAKPTIGEETFEKETSSAMAQWLTQDRNTTDANLALMQKSLEKIKKNPDWVSGRFVGRMPELLRSDLSLEVERDIRKAAQSSLKATLGSQFTAQEGERIMNFAFNPKLTPEQNIEALQADINALVSRKRSLDEKAQYFLNNRRSMAGWKGEDLFLSKPNFTEDKKSN